MYKIKVNIDCDGCAACVEVCPSEVIEIQNGVAVVSEAEDCVGCESCVEACPKGSIVLEEV